MEYNSIILLSIILIITLSSSLLFKVNFEEGYSNYNLANPGEFPSSEEKPLLTEYPFTGNKDVSRNTEEDIWWYYPVFEVGSYTQITNNLKYRRNPDDGECSRAEFCGTLYHDKKNKTNISKPLPPAPPVDNENVRVGYYTTNHNLFLGSQLGPELPVF
jgi:hypothetical protein